MLSRRSFIAGIVAGSSLTLLATNTALAKVFVGNLSFKGVGPNTVTGSGSVAQDGDRVTVTLGKDFKTHDRSDLFLLLHKSARPKRASKSKVAALGKLKSQGTQNFNIGMPPTVLGQYKSVAVWSRDTNTIFGYATIAG